MNLPSALFTMRWLIRDTFLQSISSGIFWLMLTVSVLCILFCLSVSVTGDTPLTTPGEVPSFVPRKALNEKELEAAKKEGIDVVSGEMTMMFGAIRVPLGRDRSRDIKFLQLLLAGGVADMTGLLLALIWTAGFLPTFLEPSAASVLLAKPVSRWSLIIGKYVGVLTFVAFQAVIFVGGTFLALGLTTGVWDVLYLLCVPMLLLHFAIFYSFSTLIAVCTRSTVACVFGSILFWFLCWGMNFGRHAMVAVAAETPGLSAGMHTSVEIGYWILPKPADMGILLFDSLHAEGYFGKAMAFQNVQAQGAFWPALSILSSVVFTIMILGLAAWQFVTTDY